MIKRELAKDPKLANESWDRFLPKFKKQNVKSKKPSAAAGPSGANAMAVGGSSSAANGDGEVREVKKKKVYTPFPPPQQPSKIDLQLESGEYFLGKKEKKEREFDARKKAQQDHAAKRNEQRELAFVPPTEGGEAQKKRKRSAEGEGSGKAGEGAQEGAEEDKKRKKDKKEKKGKKNKEKKRHADDA